MNAIDRFSDLKIVCIGDLMLDRFVYGDASRISPEAPIPVVRQARVLETLGGVGNAARNLRDLGAQVEIIALAGADMAGSSIREIMAEQGMADHGVLTDPARKTSEKVRIIARQQQMLRLDVEDTHEIDASLTGRIKKLIDEGFKNAHAVILSDYGKGLLTHEVIRYAVDTARRLSLPILVDPKGHDYTKYKGATLVTPNLAELSLASGHAGLSGDAEIISAARELIRSCDFTAVIATRSKDGMSIIPASGDVTHLASRVREVFDVSGAGDTVIAVMALGLAAGLPMAEAAHIANTAGGVVVGKLGTATLNRMELIRALSSEGSLNNKILNWEEAQQTVAHWRAAGQHIVTTNGAFDILHQGHVTLLNHARSLGDRLVVMLNSDASIKRYKSPTRPINPGEARAKVMAALACVDAVVMFGDTPEEDDKPLKILDLLAPDIHVKGGDYELEALPETPVVRAKGGEVVIVPFVDGYSTTSTLEKLKAS